MKKVNPILLEAINAFINNDTKRADALFHKFTIEAAKSAHRSIVRESLEENLGGDMESGLTDEISANKDEIAAEEFNEAEGDDFDLEAGTEDLAGDMAPEGEASEGGDEPTGDFSMEPEGEASAEPEATSGDDDLVHQDEFQEIKDQIDELIAQFNDFKEEEGSEEAPEETPEEEAGEPEEGEAEEGEAEAEETEEDLDKLAEEIEEAINLSKVNVTMGGEQGGVKFAGTETNTKTPVASTSKPDLGGKPVKINSKNVTSFEKEAGPSVEGKNKTWNEKSAKDLKSVTAKTGGEGPGKFAGTETNVKSPFNKK